MEEKTTLSAGLVIFRKKENKIEFLLLHYPPRYRFSKGHWGFIKGHVEEKEDLHEAAIRECKEEAGIDNRYINIIKDFQCETKYTFKEQNFKEDVKEFVKVNKTVIYLLAEAKDDCEIKLSYEHDDFRWVDYNKAYELIIYKEDRECLKKAYAKILSE